MRKLIWVALAFCLAAMPSHAQNVPQADVALGYSYLHVNGSDGISGYNNNGFSGSVAYNVTSAFGVVGDFGVYHGSVDGVGLTFESYTFGPRFSFRGNDRFVPFVQAVFGGAHENAITVSGITTPGSNAFAFSFGGGTDIPIAKDDKIALRPQFDYVGLRNDGSTTNTERVTISVVFNIGGK